MYRIGIDLGGTKTEGIVMTPDGHEVYRKRIATPQSDGYTAIINSIVHLIDELRGHVTGSCDIGICTPGTISPTTGKIRNSNTICLIGEPLQKDLEQKLNQKIFMHNDANCFALAESIRGAGRDYQTVFGVIMGTGVGGGIVMKNRIVPGAGGIAGEWGHHKISREGPQCYCGKRGCVETYISGPALERLWLELTGETLSLEKICMMNDHKHYAQWKARFLTWFGVGLANVINILDPEVVILGGGVSNISFLYTEGIEAVKQYIFSDKPNTPILKNELGDSAGVIGAAYLGVWT